MSEDQVDLLAIDRGAVTAPAGCGKTHMIAKAITRHMGDKPILVLTHTNAGVAALRGRLQALGVPSRNYRLSTIDGWAMRLLATFPVRSAIRSDLLQVSNPPADYPIIREAATQLISAGHISDILTASYSRLLVDEYQDCTLRQHQLIVQASQCMPTCILGDPMQAIFGFRNDELPDWAGVVCAHFALAGKLDVPWRWIVAKNESLGKWLMGIRSQLTANEAIDMRSAPGTVKWIELDGKNNYQRQLNAALVKSPIPDGRILVIGDSANLIGRRKMAAQTPGAIMSEAVDLSDLVEFASSFVFDASDALKRLVDFAGLVMTNVSSLTIVQRVQSLTRGTAHKAPTKVENCAIAFVRVPTYRGAVDLLEAIGGEKGVRVFRPMVLTAATEAMCLCDATANLSLRDAAIRVRDQLRYVGRALPRRTIGSTLLLKGLEAEVAVILDADSLDTPNLYVAMTRASYALLICSRSLVLQPKTKPRK